MQKIDFHIDVADLYQEFNFTQDDFFSKKDIVVTLDKLLDTECSVFGASTYADESVAKNDYYSAVKQNIDWYKTLSSKSEILIDLSKEAISEKKVGFVLTIEGSNCFRSPDDFIEFYNLGVRCISLTWKDKNKYASGNASNPDTGLTALGKDLLKSFNEKPVLLDISHLSNSAFKEAKKIYFGPMIASHSNISSVYETSRNLTDEMIQEIVDRDGVIGLFPLVEAVGDDDWDLFFRHISYVADKWGIQYVGISSDIYPLEEYPFIDGATSVHFLKSLESYLLQKMSTSEVQAVFYNNWQRVLRTINIKV